MNDLTHTDNVPKLPELSQASIDRIEDAVFSDIAHERTPQHVPVRKSRRRAWLTGLGVAAAIVAGVLITPPLLDTVGVSTAEGGGSIAEQSDRSSSNAAPDSVESSSELVNTDVDGAEREVIVAAQATMRVDDVTAAIDAITALARSSGKYCRSRSATGWAR